VRILKAVIVTHDDTPMKLKDISNKGSIKEAVENGVQTTIMIAYKSRMKPDLIDGNPPHSAKDIAKVANDGGGEDGDVEVNYTSVRLGKCDQVLLSDLVGCTLWMANIVQSCGLNKRTNDMCIDLIVGVSQEIKLEVNQF
jgi:hypothetical protein